MSEKTLQAKIFKAVGGRANARLFRNNIGVAWMGKALTIKQAVTVTLQPGDVVISQGRRVKFGLHTGSGDLIGWRKLLITPAMVGRTIAQFLSMEIKTQSGRVSDDQMTWANVVNKSGGQAAVVRSEVEAVDAVTEGF